MADARSESQLERWISFGTTIIAPATVLSGLLFYFGYVSSRAQYEYFGIDVDTIGLGTRDYVMRSPQPLLVPILVLTLVGIGAVLLHAEVRKRIASTPSHKRGPHELAHFRRLARRGILIGLVLLGAGIALLLSYPYLREWSFFNLVTPLLLATGTAVVAYVSRIQSLLPTGASLPVVAAASRVPEPSYATSAASVGDGSRASGSGFSEAPGPSAAATMPASPTAAAASAHAANSMVALRRAAGVLIFVVIVANIFWATATIAQWSGRGLAHYNAKHLDRLPSVILDTQERLVLHSPGVEETVLPTSAGQTFHYRYRHLRLLIQGHDRMFLVPDQWSPSDTTLIVQLDDSVRVQFQFVNDAP